MLVKRFDSAPGTQLDNMPRFASASFRVIRAPNPPHATMDWARQIDFEDLLEGDARLVYEHCGEDVLLALLQAFAGKSMYLRGEIVTAIQKRYIRERAGELTVKELALRLDVSTQFVYDTIQDEQEEKEPPNLFTSEQIS